MLFEFYRYLTSPCLPSVKAMGYLREIISMEARYKRCHSDWQPHLDHCQQVIRHAIQSTPRSGTAIILGSGLLLDVPLKLLAEHFDQVLLVDVVHLRPVRKAVRRYRNVRLIEADVTGVIEPLHRGSEVPRPSFDPSHHDAVFTVSLNLLSQLSLLPVEFAKRRGLIPQDDTRFAKTITAHHLDFLRNLTGKVCLITETERLVNGVFNNDPLYGISLPQPDKTWHWNIAPHPEVDPHDNHSLNMAAFYHFNQG